MVFFRELSLPEIAALSKKYQPISGDNAFELREQEQLLKVSLQKYLSSLSQAQQEFVMKACKAMREEMDG